MPSHSSQGCSFFVLTVSCTRYLIIFSFYMVSYKALGCCLLPYSWVCVGVCFSKKASTDISAGTLIQIHFLSSLCQSKHYVTSRHFQEHLFNQNLGFTSSLIKQWRWPNMGYAIKPTSSEILEYTVFIPRDGLLFAITLPLPTTERTRLIREPKTHFYFLLPSISCNQATLLRGAQIRRAMWPHVTFKMQDTLSPKVVIATANAEGLLTELRKVESCSGGRSYTGARGEGRIGGGVLQASCRAGP